MSKCQQLHLRFGSKWLHFTSGRVIAFHITSVINFINWLTTIEDGIVRSALFTHTSLVTFNTTTMSILNVVVNSYYIYLYEQRLCDYACVVLCGYNRCVPPCGKAMALQNNTYFFNGQRCFHSKWFLFKGTYGYIIGRICYFKKLKVDSLKPHA